MFFRPTDSNIVENNKKLRKGEVLIREGDAIENLYLLKSGRLTIFIERSNKKIEVGQIFQGQVVGEKALFGPSKMAFSVMAATECNCLEIPLKVIEPHFAALNGIVRGVTKGTIDALAETRKELQSLKIEHDSIPCDRKYIAKIFAVIYLTANMTGTKKEDHVLISFNTLKLYSNRIFLEPHTRVFGAVEILVKLKYAELVYKINDEGEEELSDIKLFNVKLIEDFSDYFQHQYFKSGKNEILIVDKLAMKLAGALADLSENEELDHKRAVNMDYEALITALKDKHGIELKTGHFDLLEKKGLYAVRKTKNDKVYLSFDREEFKKSYINWTIINEFDKWNENGFINMKEEEELKKAQAKGAAECPSCAGVITPEQKFCPSCGHKLLKAA